jgi:hypothetical protein
MTLDDLQSEWEKDCEIDSQKIDTESSRSPKLHAKYISELINYKLKLTKTQLDLINLRAKKMKYFRGEMTSEELLEEGWKQWPYRTLKTEIEGLIDSDPDVQKIAAREAYTKTAIMFLESVLGEIRTRSFHCKNIVEFQRFRAGG